MDTLSEVEIASVLRNELKEADFELQNCSQGDNSDLSVGFLSSPNCVTLTYKSKGNINTLHLFLKRLPKDGYHREVILAVNAFERENLVYTNFLNNFQQYFKGSPFPKCFLSTTELIVLEDLSRLGFRTPKTGDTFTKEECEKAVEAVAMLHASSLIYEKKNNKRLIDVMPSLAKPSVITLEVEMSKNFYFSSVQALRAVADNYEYGYSHEIKEKAFKFMETMPDSLGPSATHPNVLCHADLWTNNIMFQYGTDGRAEECRLVDFQFSSYSSPAFDLLMLLYNCAPPAARPGLLELYLRVLGELLAGDSPLDRRQYRDMLAEAEPLLLAVSAVCIHFTEIPAKVLAPHLADSAKHRAFLEGDRTSVVLQGLSLSATYRKRVLDSLSSLFEYFNNK